MIQGQATPEGTRRYAARFSDRPAGHFRQADGLTVSSIGLGTYLGDMTDADDALYEAAAEHALRNGINVLDSAIVYRAQRSERNIGRVLTRLFAAGELARDEVVVATKGGFVPFDGEQPADPGAWLQRTWFDPGLIDPAEFAAGCHCMTPNWLEDQVERSRRNLNLETIDIYYIHNPETQLDDIDRGLFDRRLAAAFVALEKAASIGAIVRYGLATWSGFRLPADQRAHLSLTEIIKTAREAVGPDHRFRVVQLPLNLAMVEAWLLPTQTTDEGPAPFLAAARAHGIVVMTSGSILQGRLSRGLPESIARIAPGLTNDAARALQFTRSVPGVTTALVGMKQIAHVESSLSVSRTAPIPGDDLSSILR